MGRFYADLKNLSYDDLPRQSGTQCFVAGFQIPNMSIHKTSNTKGSSSSTDQDGDVVMTDVHIPSPSSTSFMDKFTFEFFSFDENQKMKTADSSPAGPQSSTSRELSTSTASPTSYFFDASPNTPSSSPSPRAKIDTSLAVRPRVKMAVLPPPPSKPLDWMWSCHRCRARYSLSVTRRCLHDGHYYCSGTSSSPQRNIKRRKAHKSCTSEFDYVGWQDWGRWSRKCKALKDFSAGKENGPVLKGCEGCSFPSGPGKTCI